MEIRRALTTEAETLSALAVESKAHWGYSIEDMARWRDQLTITVADIVEQRIWVGVVEGEIVGFYALVPSAEAWELAHLWVTPRFMGQGIGKALLAHALDVTLGGVANSVTVDADPNAEAFYVSCGAIRCGQIPAPISGHPDRMRPQLFFHPRQAPFIAVN